MAVSMYLLSLPVEKNKQELNACIKLGIKNLRSEGYNRERLLKIMANAKKDQEYWKMKFPHSETSISSIALVKACELLLPTCD